MYYDQDYFKWQKKLGELAAKINKDQYSKHIKESDCVIDFGSGGGFLLQEIVCREKIGIEINPVALSYAVSQGVRTIERLNEIPDEWADVVISSHALEHTHNPLEELRNIAPKLKKGGKIIFITPFERTNSYKTNDVNQHLFTWSPMNLGNLFTVAGYDVMECKELLHRFPPRPFFWYSMGENIFHLMCKITAYVFRSLSQTKIIATRPA